jgi:hypothetical protein
MHKNGAANPAGLHGQNAAAPERKYSSRPRNLLIFKAMATLLFWKAFHRNHGISRACGANTGDINKVIHRNSEFLKIRLANQALAVQIAESFEHRAHRLAQFWGFSRA